MIKIAVIEDELMMRETICQCIGDMEEFSHIIMLDTHENAEAFLAEEKEYDIVISDISLPGWNGIELGKYIREQEHYTYLIFLTSHTEYAVESYELEADQYIKICNVRETSECNT